MQMRKFILSLLVFFILSTANADLPRRKTLGTLNITGQSVSNADGKNEKFIKSVIGTVQPPIAGILPTFYAPFTDISNPTKVTIGATALSFSRSTIQGGVHSGIQEIAPYYFTKAIDVPVINKMDVTYSGALGYGLDPNTTAYAIRSREFNDVAWTKTNITVTPNIYVGIDGIANKADTLAATANNATIKQTIDNGSLICTTNHKPIISAHFRTVSGTLDHTDIKFTVESGLGTRTFTAGLQEWGTGSNGTITTTMKKFQLAGEYWQAAENGEDIIVGIEIVNNGDSIIADAFMVESYTNYASYASSASAFIETTNTTVARTWPDMTMNVSELGSGKCTIACMVQPQSIPTNNASAALWGGYADWGAGAVTFYTQLTGADKIRVVLGAGANFDSSVISWSLYDWISVIISWDFTLNTREIWVDGVSVGTSALAISLSSWTNFRLGSWLIVGASLMNLSEFRVYEDIYFDLTRAQELDALMRANLGL